MIGYRLDIRRSGDAQAPARVAAVLQPARMNPVIGRAAANVFVSHLRGLDRTRPNRLGGRRTHFYLAAARGTSFQAVGDGIIVSISSVGIRQRYFGGTIRPRPGKKYLTVPAAAEAHGKTAREFADLELVFDENRRPVALATKSTLGVSITQDARGRIVKRQTGSLGKILFWLRRSVTQRADRSVLPEEAAITAVANAAQDAVVQRAWRREGQTPPPGTGPIIDV